MLGTIGTINPPPAVGNFDPNPSIAIGQLLEIVFYTMVIVAGVYTLFNFILAGYAFLSAGDDPKQIQTAWAKIYQSIIGLIFAAGSFVLAAVIGLLIFGDANAIIAPDIITIGP